MKKKGFTLIELLAVIVILAILALIAIPIVINIINDSRENSHKRSIETYERSIENAIATWQSKNDGEIPKYISDYDVQTSGEKVACDNEIKGIDGDDGIELTNCYVVDSKGNKKSKDKYNIKNGKVSKVGEENDSSNNKAYSVGDKIKVANEYYYVIADSGSNQDYVTTLKANPLKATEINTYGGGQVNRYTDSNVGTAYQYGDANHTGGMAYYSSPNCGYTIPGGSRNSNGCTNEGATNYNNSDIKYVIDNWSQAKFTNGELKAVDGYGARLATKEELQKIGWPNCTSKECPKETDTPSWIYAPNYEYYYLTMSQWYSSSIYMWSVDADGSLYAENLSTHSSAVRPVINVYKRVIQN